MGVTPDLGCSIRLNTLSKFQEPPLKLIITVSNIEAFAAADGIFKFINTDGKLSFIIISVVHLSSSLLSRACKV